LIFSVDELLLVDDQAITIDSTFNGNTEEGVIPDIFGAGTTGWSAGRTATGKSEGDHDSSEDGESFLHDFISLINRLLKLQEFFNNEKPLPVDNIRQKKYISSPFLIFFKKNILNCEKYARYAGKIIIKTFFFSNEYWHIPF
jgi:hypothetical protein